MGSLSKLLKFIANSLDKRFPEKMTTAQVSEMITSLQSKVIELDERMAGTRSREMIDVETQISSIYREIASMKEEFNKLKTFMAIKSRVMNNMPPMGVPIKQ